jgi:hypothetical protein
MLPAKENCKKSLHSTINLNQLLEEFNQNYDTTTTI